MIKSFINNNASLKDLSISIWKSGGKSFFEIVEPILNNSKFISNIESFRLHSGWPDYFRLYSGSEKKEYRNLLTPLLPLLTSIKHIYIDTDIEKGSIPDLIQSQTQLLSFSIDSVTPNILDAFKYCSSTLTSIEFVFCDFQNISLFDKLRYLIRLETLKFCYCRGMTTQTFHPLKNMLVYI